MEDFTLTQSKLIEELQKKGITKEEAEKLFRSTQDYLVRTDTKPNNKDIFEFINKNEDRLREE